MYDVIRQAERLGANHHHHHHHHQRHHLRNLSANHVSYQPTSFCRIDPYQAYNLYGLYASDAIVGSSCSDNGAVLPTAGFYGSNYSPVSPGSTLAEHVPFQHPKWSKPVIIDTTGIQWDQRQRQYGCPMAADVSGVYRHGSVISKTVTPTASGASGQAAASRLSQCSSPGLATSSLVAFQHQQHCSASCAQSSVTGCNNDTDEDVMLQCVAPASPRSATYQPNSANTIS